MSKIILVTGGARSGKSGFAESLCREQNNSTAYIATSVAFDDEMKERFLTIQLVIWKTCLQALGMMTDL